MGLKPDFQWQLCAMAFVSTINAQDSVSGCCTVLAYYLQTQSIIIMQWLLVVSKRTHASILA